MCLLSVFPAATTYNVRSITVTRDAAPPTAQRPAQKKTKNASYISLQLAIVVECMCTHLYRNEAEDGLPAGQAQIRSSRAVSFQASFICENMRIMRISNKKEGLSLPATIQSAYASIFTTFFPFGKYFYLFLFLVNFSKQLVYWHVGTEDKEKGKTTKKWDTVGRQKRIIGRRASAAGQRMHSQRGRHVRRNSEPKSQQRQQQQHQ